MGKQETFYITTAISYPNGVPHIGHAYEAIATDAIARFERLDGKDVLFLTGTDEHGLKMKQTAIKEGVSPRELADRNSARFRDMAAALNLSNDDFIRTTEPRHYEACQELWRRMEAKGDIFLKTYGGWYSVRDETYYKETETEVREDGQRYATPTGTEVAWQEEETYFFRLSRYEDALLDHYEANPDFILPPERRNEVISFVRSGLDDLSVSRTTLDWGIPVPGHPGHVMYVWIDALNNYVTATGVLSNDDNERRRFWPCNVHVIGKDIIRFHAIYWPAFLMSAGLPLPKRVFGHGFVLNKGEKMSKSVGNVLDPFALAEHYGVDQLRHFFLREVAFGSDGNYSPETIAARINADLANGLGNLAQRSLSMIAKGFGGVVPEPVDLTEADKALLAKADGVHAIAREAMDRQAIKTWLDAVWDVVGEGDRYFANEKPFDKALSNERKGTILYVTAEVVRQLAILVQPAMPASAAKLLDLLAQPEGEARQFEALGAAGRLQPGTQLPEPQGVFPRYVDPAAATQKSGSQSAEAQQAARLAKQAKKEANRKKSQSNGEGSA
ncbi:MAG: methionine--tRNA ligase [Hyphomicrobiaceae bacterium]|nr:methionine--tRNA ligase [Hyphomicrobiaceae bacterium]